MPEGITGLRVRFRWPDGGLSDGCGLVTGTSPTKRYPQWWPLADFCGYLPAAVREGTLEAQRRQFALEARAPVVGCSVLWDSVVTDGGLVMLPRDRWRDGWVADCRWLATAGGGPVEVPPLIECVQLAGAML